jgi:hypothetical protein
MFTAVRFSLLSFAFSCSMKDEFLMSGSELFLFSLCTPACQAHIQLQLGDTKLKVIELHLFQPNVVEWKEKKGFYAKGAAWCSLHMKAALTTL